ncbi:hypothetical protein Scep_013853 [Stephania cephalantha]|uniref:Calcium uniporter protein C-terminal domain-containing protein n=1 Tax=Stephania cephalantha TaxID=152367 RepID=A0AAP0IZW3_9MAGN
MWRSNGFRFITRPSMSHLGRRNAAAAALFSNSSGGGGGDGGDDKGVSLGEAKRLLRLVNVEALKRKLCTEGKEMIGYSDLIKACQAVGVSRSVEEAAAFAKVLDEAGVVLLFRDKVYLHPHKLVDSVRKAVPLALSPEDDPRRDELKMLQKKKEEIDMLAHKHVRRILGAGLGFSLVQIGLFFRLTFWDFSWDIMEPVAFFATSAGLVIGYGYFLFTSKDPSYQDLRKRLFLSRQQKLCKRMDFDLNRYIELQKQCKSPLDTTATSSFTRRNLGDLELEDDFHINQHSGV